MTDRIGYLSLVMMTATLWAVMWFSTFPQIIAGFGGYSPPDLRLSGYSFADMQIYLTAMTAEGLQAYSGLHLYLDAIFPALLALCFALPINGLLRHRPAALRIVAVLLPMAAALYDYLENILVARMVTLGADGITPKLVSLSSRATELKAQLVMVSAMLVALLIIVNWWELRRSTAE